MVGVQPKHRLQSGDVIIVEFANTSAKTMPLHYTKRDGG